MSAAEYFDLQTGQSLARTDYLGDDALHLHANKPAFPIFRDGKVPGATNRVGEVKAISLILEEVMFTSRVPLSTWTFAFAVNEKLWVSDLTTLYFGKRTPLNRKIYRGRMFIPDQGTNIDVGITAYNSYGDMFKTSQPLRVSAASLTNTAGELVKIDEDWTQLLFKFRVRIER
ncbi:MAG: hypothetical protein PVG20_00490 [Thioalkalispiraceae bacterium]|jgi:hypothetical protein